MFTGSAPTSPAEGQTANYVAAAASDDDVNAAAALILSSSQLLCEDFGIDLGQLVTSPGEEDDHAPMPSPPPFPREHVRCRLRNKVRTRQETQGTQGWGSTSQLLGVSRDEEKRRRRREQNRAAAQRCRERKRHQNVLLCQEFSEMKTTNADLARRVALLEQEKCRLENFIQTHLNSCGGTLANEGGRR